MCATGREASSDTKGIRAETMHATFWALHIPKDAVNLALKSGGGTARASDTAPGFFPDGALDGSWTAENWGKGHGWQSAKRHQFPCWLEVRLPHEEEVDTILIQTFPPVMRGLNWLGLRNVDLQIEQGGEWMPLADPASIRANVSGAIVQSLPPVRISAIRITVVGVNTGNQEDVFYDDDDFARILQVGLYRLRRPIPFVPEDVSVQVESGPLGRIAIYNDDLPTRAPHSSSPEYLASVFRAAGYGVTFLNTQMLCIPQIFSRKNFDVFVHPYGAPFPIGTLLYDFLQAGGHLITMGGHPFRRALMFAPDGRLVDAHYDPGITVTVTRQFDYELPFREQLGMFYNGYRRLEDVANIRTAPDQGVVTTPIHLDTMLEGEVASAFVGERMSLDDGRRLAEQGIYPSYAYAAREGLANISSLVAGFPPGGLPFDYRNGYIFNWPRSRWIPLVNASDRLGRLKGSIMSLLINYEKPYAGSGWIYSGVESEDLFSPVHPEFTRALLEALRFVRRSLVLHNVESDMDCYRQGEAAKAFAVVDNFRDEPQSVSVRFEFFSRDSQTPAFTKTVALTLKPGERQRPFVIWKPARFDSDLYTIRVSLSENKGGEIDRLKTGFVVWDPKVIAQGPKIDFHDNYFHVAGQPQFLVGTRSDALYPHGEVAEDVLAWDQQFAAMYDHGMRVFSPTWFSEYIPGLLWGKEGSPIIPAQLQRLMDAQVQLAQKHGLIYQPDIFFMTREAAMEKSELSAKICEELGKRYASVPGIMFHIFDDGSGQAPFKEFQDWSRIIVDAFSRSGRNYIVTARIDRKATSLHRYAASALSFPSGGIYAPHNADPALERLVDMRAVGRSSQTSEFGLYAAGARPGDFDPKSRLGAYTSGLLAGDYSLYLMEPHLDFAQGQSSVMNWMWNDRPQLISVWGVVEANDFVPKKTLIAYRNESYFIRHFQPAFHLPKVLVVFAKEHLMRDGEAYTEYLITVMRQLIAQSVQFAVIDDSDLDRITGAGHFLIYPDPCYGDREVLEKLQARVQAGDELFLSGDFTQAIQKNGTREITWFERLAGLTWLSDRAPEESAITPASGDVPLVPYIGMPISNFKAHGAEVVAMDGGGSPVLTAYTIGGGSVLYTSDISVEGARRGLALFLKLKSIPGTQISPERPDRPVFELDRAEGGRVYTLFSTRPERPGTSSNGPWIETPETYTLRMNDKRVDLPLGAYGVSLVAVQGDNSIDGLEGQGEFKENGSVLMGSEQHVMVMSLDQHALGESEAVALFPLGAGAVFLKTEAGIDTVEAGEIVNGQFRVLEKIPVNYSGGTLKFRIDEVQSQCVLLISSAGRQDRAHQLMNAALK